MILNQGRRRGITHNRINNIISSLNASPTSIRQTRSNSKYIATNNSAFRDPLSNQFCRTMVASICRICYVYMCYRQCIIIIDSPSIVSKICRGNRSFNIFKRYFPRNFIISGGTILHKTYTLPYTHKFEIRTSISTNL